MLYKLCEGPLYRQNMIINAMILTPYINATMSPLTIPVLPSIIKYCKVLFCKRKNITNTMNSRSVPSLSFPKFPLFPRRFNLRDASTPFQKEKYFMQVIMKYFYLHSVMHYMIRVSILEQCFSNIVKGSVVIPQVVITANRGKFSSFTIR